MNGKISNKKKQYKDKYEKIHVSFLHIRLTYSVA